MKLLIVVDMQNDFCTGSLKNSNAVDVIPKINDYAKSFREEDKEHNLVIFTRDTHMPNYLQTQEGKYLPVVHCQLNSKGWQIVDGIEQTPFDTQINKSTFGFTEWKVPITQIYNIVKNPQSEKDVVKPQNYFGEDLEIHMCGTLTSVCVASNALILKALLPEAKVFIHKNLCADSTKEAHEAALTVLKACQCEIVD